METCIIFVLHLYEINPDKGDHWYLHKALDFIKGPIDNLKEQKAGFLCGDSGPYALAVVIYSLLGDAQNSQKYLKKFRKPSSQRIEMEASFDVLYP